MKLRTLAIQKTLYSFPRSPLLCAINEARGCVRAVSAINESGAVRAGEWVRISPYGRFPVVVMVDGKPRRVVQNVDRAAADAMVTAFNSVSTRLASLFRGAPILEGHSDDEQWRKENPGVSRAAVGRIRQLEARDDGLYGLPALNERGQQLTGGEAPAFDSTSPRWNLELLGDRATSREARPYEFVSLALTNTPNIPGNLHGLNEGEDPVDDSPTQTTTTMHPLVIELLALLGQTLAADAAPEAQDAALKAAIAKAKEATAAASNATGAADKLKEAEGKLAAAETKATTASNEASAARSALAAERAARSGLVVNSAIAAGRITQAEGAGWVTALNEAPDFGAKVGELEKLKPKVNMQSQLGGAGGRRAESASTSGITAINEAVSSYMAEHKITDRDRAWHAVKQAKPELFK